MTEQDYKKQAVDLAATPLELIKAILIKHNKAIVEEIHDQLAAKDKQIKAMLEALFELVNLKDYKDKNGKDLVYQRDQPKAWDTARELVKIYGDNKVKAIVQPKETEQSIKEGGE